MIKRQYKRVISAIACLTLAITMVLSLTIQAFADESKVLTLGKDLSQEQKDLILEYFGITEAEVQVVEVTNEDEHSLLDGIATPQQIGTHTYSCAYIEPTHDGGIHIKTANINWVTCEMIRNALITGGVTDCNVVVASPIEVSGTGALTGIFKAYEQIGETQEITEEKKELASEELIETCNIAESIGQEEASELVSDLKEDVLTSDEELLLEDILKLIQDYLKTKNIELTDEQIESLANLLVKISQQEYDIDKIKQAYKDMEETIEKTKEKAEETLSLLDKIGKFFSDIWNKLTGGGDTENSETKNTEAEKEDKTPIDIFNSTKDSLLGDNAVITNTETTNETQQNNESETQQEDEKGNKDETKEKHWYDWILSLFNAGNAKEEDETNTENTETEKTETEKEDKTDNIKQKQDTEQKQEVEQRQDNTEGIEQSNNEETKETNEEQGILDYVTDDINTNTGNTSPSLEDITK